jgi:hypothetical protein
MTDLVLEGKLFLAPIDRHVQRILDVATGTGKAHVIRFRFHDLGPLAELVMTPRDMGYRYG